MVSDLQWPRALLSLSTRALRDEYVRPRFRGGILCFGLHENISARSCFAMLHCNPNSSSNVIFEPIASASA